jgi:DNA-binding response OmpR family regulator
MEHRILVLDDDPGILEAIDLSLTYCGFQVRPLLSGDNFFRMIDDFEPDLIILDYLLSGKNGGDICQELKKNPEKKDIPVIMLSAYADAEKRTAECGYDSFLSKPFDLTLLINEINNYLDPQPVIVT